MFVEESSHCLLKTLSTSFLSSSKQKWAKKIAQLYREEILHIQTQIASEDSSYTIETKMTLSTYLPNSMMSSLLLQGLPGNSSCTHYQLRILKSSTIRLLSAFSGSAGTKAQELLSKQPRCPHTQVPHTSVEDVKWKPSKDKAPTGQQAACWQTSEKGFWLHKKIW